MRRRGRRSAAQRGASGQGLGVMPGRCGGGEEVGGERVEGVRLPLCFSLDSVHPIGLRRKQNIGTANQR